jgi:hypothetical protein
MVVIDTMALLVVVYAAVEAFISDGDLAMLRYTSGLRLLIHHDDAEREVAYDREFRLSPLSEALDKAADYGITVVSMKRDWKTVFAT